MPTDTERLDFIEMLAKRSQTGISFDWIPSVEGARSGYRMMSRHYIRPVKANIRLSIDDAMGKGRAG
jgi:hypothetical protein